MRHTTPIPGKEATMKIIAVLGINHGGMEAK